MVLHSCTCVLCKRKSVSKLEAIATLSRSSDSDIPEVDHAFPVLMSSVPPLCSVHLGFGQFPREIALSTPVLCEKTYPCTIVLIKFTTPVLNL